MRLVVIARSSVSRTFRLEAHQYVWRDNSIMSDLTGRALLRSMIASNASIDTALEPVELSERIGKEGCDVGSRFAVQPICLD
jgi:hypothetical protein